MVWALSGLSAFVWSRSWTQWRARQLPQRRALLRLHWNPISGLRQHFRADVQRGVSFAVDDVFIELLPALLRRVVSTFLGPVVQTHLFIDWGTSLLYYSLWRSNRLQALSRNDVVGNLPLLSACILERPWQLFRSVLPRDKRHSSEYTVAERLGALTVDLFQSQGHELVAVSAVYRWRQVNLLLRSHRCQPVVVQPVANVLIVVQASRHWLVHIQEEFLLLFELQRLDP